MIYLIREARHVGIAIGLDSIRYYAIDIDIRNLADYLILKGQGVQGLSSDLEWLYSFFNPKTLRYMKPEHFIMISSRGALGLGYFPFHEWHKREKENILKSVGLIVEYGELLERAQDKGLYKSVGDREHTDIIEMYAGQNLGMLAVAHKLTRSTRTISEHVKKHNQAVERSGFCAACKRAGSSFFDKKAVRCK